MGLIDENSIVVERYFYDAWGQPEIQPRDSLAPVVDQVLTAPDGLLIVFSESVLPPALILPLPAAQSAPVFASSMALANSAVTVTLNGQALLGTLRYDESSPAGFGRTLHFV